MCRSLVFSKINGIQTDPYSVFGFVLFLIKFSSLIKKTKKKKNKIVLSMSSKFQSFLSLYIHHMKQCRAAIHNWPFRWCQKQPGQQANNSSTVFSITQQTPNKSNTIGHKSAAIDSEVRDDLLIPHCICIYNTNPKATYSFSVNCQSLRFSPKQQYKQRKHL